MEGVLPWQKLLLPRQEKRVENVSRLSTYQSNGSLKSENFRSFQQYSALQSLECSFLKFLATYLRGAM